MVRLDHSPVRRVKDCVKVPLGTLWTRGVEGVRGVSMPSAARMAGLRASMSFMVLPLNEWVGLPLPLGELGCEACSHTALDQLLGEPFDLCSIHLDFLRL